jgi:hypothetical protein
MARACFSPPMDPRARFIWPMPMITSCPRAMTMLTDIAEISTKMLKGDKKAG